jgi:hypothetical protein
LKIICGIEFVITYRKLFIILYLNIMKRNTIPTRFDLLNQANRILLLITLGLILVSVSSIKATEPFSMQQTTITGKITDLETDTALVGVRVQVMFSTDPSAKPAVSQKDGTYSLNLPENAKTILFSLTGYDNLIVELGGRTVINVVLSKEEKDPAMWRDLMNQ